MKPELHILLQSDDGWHSTGSEVHYVDYPVYDMPGTSSSAAASSTGTSGP